eukprot:TRINITY_DN11210_c0_g1_i1.p1 TRINITY_DN11210_c0_g1~~TRINITY_DN11210_c0_g1_i1.p1  ORF type:complete len:546 (+),score=74.38 TRINITY_DN11210_c0_g1_i1:28-1638(+)
MNPCHSAASAMLLASIRERRQLHETCLADLRQLEDEVMLTRAVPAGRSSKIHKVADDALFLIHHFAGGGLGGSAGFFHSCRSLRQVPYASRVVVRTFPPGLSGTTRPDEELRDFDGRSAFLGQMESRWRRVESLVINPAAHAAVGRAAVRVLAAFLSRVLPHVTTLELPEATADAELVERAPFAFPFVGALLFHGLSCTTLNSNPTAAPLPWLSLPPNLRKLRVTGAPLPRVQRMCNLTSVGCEVDPQAHQLLRHCPELVELEYGIGTVNSIIPIIPQDCQWPKSCAEFCPKLEDLKLHAPISMESAEALVKLTCLRGISLDQVDLQILGVFARSPSAPKLRSIRVGHLGGDNPEILEGLLRACGNLEVVSFISLSTAFPMSLLVQVIVSHPRLCDVELMLNEEADVIRLLAGLHPNRTRRLSLVLGKAVPTIAILGVGQLLGLKTLELSAGGYSGGFGGTHRFDGKGLLAILSTMPLLAHVKLTGFDLLDAEEFKQSTATKVEASNCGRGLHTHHCGMDTGIGIALLGGGLPHFV